MCSELTIGMATSDDVLYLMKFLETGHVVFAKQTRVHGEGGRDHVVSEHAFPEQSFAMCRCVDASVWPYACRTSGLRRCCVQVRGGYDGGVWRQATGRQGLLHYQRPVRRIALRRRLHI